ncbi:FtsK/SpoIIIE domain-containing protein [Streptomyces sp. NPDC051940]|uniref:FtsK/SpoIIIE domain-containing protein n=1 Tax=Streptomyces sp. NPDC051940 TaxID=3155675 RepID=UPI0034388D49
MRWLIVLALLVIAGALVLRWKRPDWYWRTFGVAFAVLKLVTRYRPTMEACGLTVQPPAWKLEVAKIMHRPPSPPKAPRILRLRPTRAGLVLRLRLRPGQCLADFQTAADPLRHALQVYSVGSRELRPGVVEVKMAGYDVLERVRLPRVVDDRLLRVPVAMRDDGSVHYRDFRQTPHELNVGATESGKSTFQRQLITELAKQPVALVGIDCKKGVELGPLARRLSGFAVDQDSAAALLDALVCRMTAIYDVIRREQRISADIPDEEITSDIWGLPEHLRPVPVVVFIDEIAELLLVTKDGRERRLRTITALIRLVQLGRAAGIYVEACGQRFGADLGDGVTLLRAQLTGRVSHRVNEQSTAEMTFGDIAEDALIAVQIIPNDRKGVAIAGTASGEWAKIRAPYTTIRQAANVCNAHAHLTPDLPELEAFRPALQPPVRLVKPRDVRLGREHNHEPVA